MKLLIIVPMLLVGCTDPDLPAGESLATVTSVPVADRIPEEEDSPEKNQRTQPVPSPMETNEPPTTPSAVPTVELQREPIFISPADPSIRYIGRFDISDPEHVCFDWSGVAI